MAQTGIKQQSNYSGIKFCYPKQGYTNITLNSYLKDDNIIDSINIWSVNHGYLSKFKRWKDSLLKQLTFCLLALSRGHIYYLVIELVSQLQESIPFA